MPIKIVMNKTKIKIVTPNPILFINSDSIYSLTVGCSFGTKILLRLAKNPFQKEIKLNEKPLKKH